MAGCTELAHSHGSRETLGARARVEVFMIYVLDLVVVLRPARHRAGLAARRLAVKRRHVECQRLNRPGQHLSRVRD